MAIVRPNQSTGCNVAFNRTLSKVKDIGTYNHIEVDEMLASIGLMVNLKDSEIVQLSRIGTCENVATLNEEYLDRLSGTFQELKKLVKLQRISKLV